MKVLILSASPHRDEIVDCLIKEELGKYGHEVYVRPCLREGRPAILEIQPDVVVVPPIRNTYSSDLVGVIKHWGMGIVSRHTEPSCDKKDFEKMEPHKRWDVFGKYPYEVDAELVWSKDEADILNKMRKVSYKTHAVGAFTVDAYKRQDLVDKHKDKEDFCKKYNFLTSKPTLLICSPWGFVDSSPDLHIDDLDDARKDIEGRDRQLAMIRQLVSMRLKERWNILLSVHPGVVQQPYKELSKELDIPLDTESTSFYLKCNVDAIIHSGSTMAIGAHYLNIPCYQFGDIYCKDTKSWWSDPESPISQISPHYSDPLKLFGAIQNYTPETNANKEALRALEKGRFGRMDGNATKRAAAIINKVKGKFKLAWPKSQNDYTQLMYQRSLRRVCTPTTCAICKEEFAIVNDSYFQIITQHVLQAFNPYFKEPPPPEVIQKMWKPNYGHACPHCSARFFRYEE